MLNLRITQIGIIDAQNDLNMYSISLRYYAIIYNNYRSFKIHDLCFNA